MSGDNSRATTTTIVRAAGSLISLALLVYLLSRQGWNEILESFGRIPAASLLLVVALVAASRLSVAARWYTLLHATDPHIPFGQSLRLTFAGLFAANFLPTTVGGDVVRLAGTLRISRNAAASATSIALDRVVGLVGMAMVLPLGLQGLLMWLRSGAAAGGAAHAVAVGSALALRWETLRSAALRTWRRSLELLALWRSRPRALLVALLFTWLHMIWLFSMIEVLLRGMGQPIGVPTIAGLWSLTYFVTLMPFSINGLGLREVSISYIFTEIGGVTLESALALALILRTLEMIASLPGAWFVPGVLSARTARPGA